MGRHDDDGRDDRSFRGAATAMVCSGVEFFDVTLYAIFAMAIGRTYFPSENAETQLLATLAIFGASFVARPFGSVIVGIFADRHGRRAALVLTASAMATATAVVALMPGYHQVGWVAPAMILLARLVQGFAFGGEIGPSTAYAYEIAPPQRRNLYASWQPAGQGLATMVAAIFGLALGAILGQGALVEWGWRIPFLFGSVVLWIALLLRRAMSETLPRAPEAVRGRRDRSIMKLLTKYPTTLVAIASQIVFGTISIYACTYMNTYLQKISALPPSISYTATAVTGLSICAGSVAGGALADAFGYRRVIYWSRAVLLFAIYPLFSVAHISIYGVLLLSSAFPFLAMVSGGASFGAITNALPPSLRSTGLSVTYAVVVCLLGGSIQFVMTALIAFTGDQLVPAYCMIVATLIGIAGVPWLSPSRSPRPLEVARA
ncbi:MFS transporter [Agrobacterium sp. BA1120]|uniref:MFS transporter n=1 Tax=Agrobacterium sp. BA1120 TaxID=3228927 RepID=UPI00336A0D09